MDDARRALRLLVFPTLVLLVVAAFLPGRLGPGVRLYALLVCAAILWLAVGGLRRAFPPVSRLRPARASRTRPRESTRGLAALENAVALGAADARDLHFRLRPRLRELAGGLLERRGVALDDEPEAARALLGDETWELVRSDRPAPDEQRARGLSSAALERVVVSLERL